MSLTYDKAVFGEDGEIYSVDKILYSFDLRHDGYNSVYQFFSDYLRLEFDHWQSFKIGAYHDQFSVKADTRMGIQSFYVGIGLNAGGKPKEVARLEYNPNKVGGSFELKTVMDVLNAAAFQRDVKQYDLAVDFPAAREQFDLIKGAKMYEEVRHSAADRTQYIGQRNKAGRCKVYNKQIESGLDYPCTRVEVTCGGDWNMTDIRTALPQIGRVGWTVENVAGLNDTQMFILRTLAHEPSRISELGRRMQDRMKPLLEELGGYVRFDLNAIEEVLKDYHLI